ncbi:9288_t:CDS:1, partial [Funneliformis geosporum]
VSCDNTIKIMTLQSLEFSHHALDNLLEKITTKISFTTNLWTGIHRSYISVPVHWINDNFELQQALHTIE